MATLQRFKFLATQCGVAESPTRSPSPRTSPLVQLRRRKTTLKMLLSLRSPARREQPLINHHKDVAGRKLRDLFVSSSPSVEEEEEEEEEEKERRKGKTKEEVLAAMAAKINAASSFQLEADTTPAWFGFRKRLLQRAWRPKLGTILEFELGTELPASLDIVVFESSDQRMILIKKVTQTFPPLKLEKISYTQLHISSFLGSLLCRKKSNCHVCEDLFEQGLATLAERLESSECPKVSTTGGGLFNFCDMPTNLVLYTHSIAF